MILVNFDRSSYVYQYNAFVDEGAVLIPHAPWCEVFGGFDCYCGAEEKRETAYFEAQMAVRDFCLWWGSLPKVEKARKAEDSYMKAVYFYTDGLSGRP